MVSSDKENISVLLASVEHSSNGLVGSGNALNSSLIHPGVTNHIRWGEVVHEESILFLCDPLGKLLCNWSSAHLRVEVVCRHLWRWDHLSLFAGELLLDATVEEESDVSILFGFGNMALLHILLAKPFGQNIAHVLRWESDWEWVVGLVLGHGCDVNVLGIGEIGLGRAINISEKLRYFADSVGTVVEEE